MNTRLYDLLSRDELRVAGLEAIFEALRANSDFAAHTVWAMRQLDAEKAWRAVWLLRRLHLERKLPPHELREVCCYAGELDHWTARLVLCQLLAETGVPPSRREELFPFLLDCARSHRVMVRAWAMTVLKPWEEDPVFRERVAEILHHAHADPRASMRARLRRLRVAAE